MEDLKMKTPSDFFKAFNNITAECAAVVAEIVRKNGGKVSLNYTEDNIDGRNLILSVPNNDFGDDYITFVEVMNGLENTLVLTDEYGDAYDSIDLYDDSIFYIYDAIVSSLKKNEKDLEN